MHQFWRVGGTPIGAVAGFVVLGLTMLTIAGCSQSLEQSSSDQASSATLSGSSIRVQDTAATAPSTGPASVAGVPVQPIIAPDLPSAAPVLASATTLPAPAAASVTSPAAPALTLAVPAKPASQPKLDQVSPTVVASVGNPILNGLGSSGMQGTAQTLNPVMMRALKQFKVASAAFPDFCRDWQRKLSERERNNLEHVKWEMRNGVETGTYVAYSTIDSCTCKEANNGVAVGTLTYKEFNYTLTGKSIDEARHSAPHATAVVPTREIFAYDKGKWF